MMFIMLQLQVKVFWVTVTSTLIKQINILWWLPEEYKQWGSAIYQTLICFIEQPDVPASGLANYISLGQDIILFI